MLLLLGDRNDSPRDRNKGKRHRDGPNTPTYPDKHHNDGKGGKGKGKGGSPKFDLPKPWDVEIGASVNNCRIMETDTHVTVGEVTLSRAALAKICGCGPRDKCWPVAMSLQPWPLKLRLCPSKSKPGHEKYDSPKHLFTTQQITEINKLAKKP